MSDDEKTCEICGRKLKTAESRRRGRGRVCDEKVNPGRGRDHPSRSRPVTAKGMQAAGPDLLDQLPVDDRAEAELVDEPPRNACGHPHAHGIRCDE